MRAALVLVLMAVMGTDGLVLGAAVRTPAVLAPAATASQAAPVTRTGPASGTAPAPAAPRVSAAPAPARAPVLAPAAAIAVVDRYYALLPRHPARAFAVLGPAARARSGGSAAYAAFYGDLAAVSVDPGATVTGPDQVTAVIHFRHRSGAGSDERYTFILATDAAGRPVIADYRRD